MSHVTIRDLRNHGGDVVDRVLAGERLTVTRAGKEVAELRPLPKPGLDSSTLLSRWKNLPAIDLETFRQDIDRLIDSSI
ncbi:MAG: type II toxin-antitoxin system prevent-host-death family antitoxin [Verrucomicrobia bacterium]|nr:type II toxin-antitoxin system prevent-host-death family antitoxin [Verrucomicrobiota bacterium]